MGKSKDSKKGKSSDHSKKARSNKSHENDQSSYRDVNSPPTLSDVLTWGILKFPELLEELSTIIASLDGGQIINPDSISNKPLGNYLNKLLRLLPLKHLEMQGWCKDKDSAVISISGHILNELLIAKTIRQPSDLTPSQLLASRSTPAILKDMIQRYPDLLAAVPTLLNNLAEGGVVQLGEMENEEVESIDLYLSI
jgi:hypothetical protein